MTESRTYNPLDRATCEAIAYNAVGRASEIGTYPAYQLPALRRIPVAESLQRLDHADLAMAQQPQLAHQEQQGVADSHRRSMAM